MVNVQEGEPKTQQFLGEIPLLMGSLLMGLGFRVQGLGFRV